MQHAPANVTYQRALKFFSDARSHTIMLLKNGANITIPQTLKDYFYIDEVLSGHVSSCFEG